MLGERLGKYSYSSNDARDHKYDGYDRPDDTPTLRRASKPLGKDTSVGGIYFAKDQIIALYKECCQRRKRVASSFEGSYNIPNAVEGRHDANEKLHSFVLADLS